MEQLRHPDAAVRYEKTTQCKYTINIGMIKE